MGTNETKKKYKHEKKTVENTAQKQNKKWDLKNRRKNKRCGKTTIS